MAEPFKNFINPALVRSAAAHLARAWPDFDAKRFKRLAETGLKALELKARAIQVCAALEATLPADFMSAAEVIEAALAPAPAGDDAAVRAPVADDGLRGWVLWPVGEFVARRGLAHPERALATLHALTQRFTAEFALRPLIVAHPALAFDTLSRWCSDDSPHVRRSVANHLNDIAKDHPALVCAWVEEHLAGATPERRALLRHASRTLIKQGDVRMLRAWGLGAPLRGSAALQLAPGALRLGESLTLSLTLVSCAARAQVLAIDYVVHHVKAGGHTTPKVFKGWQLSLPARGELVLVKRHSMCEITTRRYHPGRHGVAVQINGRTVAEASFVLESA